jgi:hypothetical protein
MSKNGVGGHTKLRIIVPDPDEDDLFHSFSVDVENEESLAKFLRWLLQIYGAPGKEIAASMLDTKALARAYLRYPGLGGEVSRRSVPACRMTSLDPHEGI